MNKPSSPYNDSNLVSSEITRAAPGAAPYIASYSGAAAHARADQHVRGVALRACVS